MTIIHHLYFKFLITTTVYLMFLTSWTSLTSAESKENAGV